MIKTHNLGFPRIGKNRELKFGLEAFWNGQLSQNELNEIGSHLRLNNWFKQKDLDFVPVGDFSFYDQVLDMSYTLGNIPDRVRDLKGSYLDSYFRTARGQSSSENQSNIVHASEMTKWFDTNYHYIVPEFSRNTKFSLNFELLENQIKEAKNAKINVKPVIIGPATYLWLGKSKDNSNKLSLLDNILPIYKNLLKNLANIGAEWIQIDEPILTTELSQEWQHAIEKSYSTLKNSGINILLTTYFGKLQENIKLACNLPVQGLHVDGINARDEVDQIIQLLETDKILSLGVVNGRNIWKTDLNETINWLEKIYEKLEDRLWIAPTCSLLHVPVDLNSEKKLNITIRSWLAFAEQKLDEIKIIAAALNGKKQDVSKELDENFNSIKTRQESALVHNESVKLNVSKINSKIGQRENCYKERFKKQSAVLKLPVFPTTTIGSFPQTKEIRQARSKFKKGELSKESYTSLMKNEIKKTIQEQEILGLDVLVHGEPERNDMVEYFGEQLNGFAFSELGWVQSYGSRCVKPPIIFGDISRPKEMTIEWINYAQSLTEKPMKGMLTGPVTILNWSFVRDDQPRSSTCYQLALAIRQEVLDLEKAGIKIIQIDEAALREGLPLRKSNWKEYLQWAIESFRITANGVKDETQIHTHMCYSEFNDIIHDIAKMDADVITIETSRSDMELLNAFKDFKYPNEIGPGVYDIHSPNIPSKDQIVKLIRKANELIPTQQLWVNPDCGLKTRAWSEVIPALKNMITAAKELRELVK